jgi:hypothetical protein
MTIYDPWHYVPVLARKPGALRNGAPFQGWVLPSAMERVRRIRARCSVALAAAGLLFGVSIAATDPAPIRRAIALWSPPCFAEVDQVCAKNEHWLLIGEC